MNRVIPLISIPNRRATREWANSWKTIDANRPQGSEHPHDPIGGWGKAAKLLRKHPDGEGPGYKRGDDQPTQVHLNLKPEQLKQPNASSEHTSLLLLPTIYFKLDRSFARKLKARPKMDGTSQLKPEKISPGRANNLFSEKTELTSLMKYHIPIAVMLTTIITAMIWLSGPPNTFAQRNFDPSTVETVTGKVISVERANRRRGEITEFISPSKPTRKRLPSILAQLGTWKSKP